MNTNLARSVAGISLLVAVGCSQATSSANVATTRSFSAALIVADSVNHYDTLAREPMVVEHPSGALFVSGYAQSTTTLWQSTDKGKTWSRVSVGTEADGAIGNSDVDLAVAPDGTLYFAQMGFNRATREGTHVAIGVSKDAGATWKWTTISKTRFDDRPWIKVAPDGTAHVIWNDGNGVRHAVSTDRGATWTGLARIHDSGGSSHLAIGPNGEIAVRITPLAASGNKFDEGVDLTAISTDGGATWRKQPAVGQLAWTAPGTPDFVPRWVEPLAWDSAGALYAFWTDTHGLWISASPDQGRTWHTQHLTPTTELSYYPYLVARGRGELAATWFSGTGDSVKAHVARIVVPNDPSSHARIVSARTFVPDSWGLSARRENPLVRSPAGEYVPVIFLRDGTLGVVSPIQNERAGRMGFTWWRVE